MLDKFLLDAHRAANCIHYLVNDAENLRRNVLNMY